MKEDVKRKVSKKITSVRGPQKIWFDPGTNSIGAKLEEMYSYLKKQDKLLALLSVNLSSLNWILLSPLSKMWKFKQTMSACEFLVRLPLLTDAIF